jgi:HYD1 signature containing ADP-ribosyltransferase
LETLTVNISNTLYHYTTEYGRLAIIESGVLRPSLKRKDGRDALYGSGQYFTNISPDIVVCESKEELTPSQKEAGQICIEQLSYRIMGGVGSPERLAYFIEFDVSNLTIEIPGTRYICLYRSEVDLDITNLIIRSGKTLG